MWYNNFMEEELKEKLNTYSKTYITLEELEKKMGQSKPYRDMANLIKQFTKDGVLKPIRS